MPLRHVFSTGIFFDAISFTSDTLALSSHQFFPQSHEVQRLNNHQKSISFSNDEKLQRLEMH